MLGFRFNIFHALRAYRLRLYDLRLYDLNNQRLRLNEDTMGLIKKIVQKIFGTPTERFLKTLIPRVKEINSFEPQFKKLSNQELREKTIEFRKRLDAGETLNELLPEAFSAVREAGSRFLSMRHYDVQILGGIAMFKDHATDSGVKRSALGLLRVDQDPAGKVTFKENVGWEEERGGLLKTIFLDGEARGIQTLADIRGRIGKYIS